MALRNNVQMANGINVSNSYIKVGTVSVVQKNILSFNALYSVNAEKPTYQEQSFQCAYNIDKENPIKQAYEYLKTLPDFAGAIDC